MIGFVHRKMSVVDAFFCLLILVPHGRKTLITTADPVNLTQCVLQENDRGLRFGCAGIADSMTWIRVGYYGRTQSSSPSNFCEKPDAPSAGACVPNPGDDRRNMSARCNMFTNCEIMGKTYSDIVSMCPSSNGGFPFAYVSYECLPRKQANGNFIDIVNLWDRSPVNRNLQGKIYLRTSGYPELTNYIVRCQVTVDGNTTVSFRLLDAYGRLLDASDLCSYSLYLYSSTTNTYREWCVTRTSWTTDNSIPVFFPALQQGSRSQDIDIVFDKTNANLSGEGALWMIMDAVNVVDNSPGLIMTVSCGSTFTPQVRPTTTTSTTTTTPSTTTATTTTTTPTTTPTTTTTTTSTTTTPTTTSTTTTITTSTTTTPTTSTTTTPTTTSTTTTPTTTSTIATTPTATSTTTTTTPTTTTPTTTSTTTTPTTTTSSATSSSVTSRTLAHTSSDTTEPFVSQPAAQPTPIFRTTPFTTFNPSSTITEKATVNNTSGEVALPSQNTNVIIGVVIAAACIVIIIVVVIVVAVICRRKRNGTSKPHSPVMVDLDSILINNNLSSAAAASKVANSLRSREHIYDEIQDPLDTIKTSSYPPQQHHPNSQTILRTGHGQSRKVSGVNKVRFTTPGGDEDMIFFPGAMSNISDDDKANRQTAQNANEVHPRLIKDSSSLKKSSFKTRQDSVPSVAGDLAAAADSGVQLNPVYGFRPADIYMY